MKKGLGLQANINGFNTTLPQTKHLNFFMGTNPVGYANGGAVRRGVPSSNMNVTQGFLPMALGFDNGGEADKTTMQSFYGFLRNNIKNYLRDLLGVEPSDQQVEDFTNSPQGQEVSDQIKIIFENETGSGVSAGAYNSGFPIGGAQKKEPPMPTETFSSAGDATKDIRQDNVPFPKNQFTGLEEGAELITPSTLGETEDTSSNILDTILDFGGNLKEEFFPAPTIKQTGGDASVMEEIMKAREDAPQVKDEEIKKSESKESTDGGITTITGKGSGKSAGAYDSGFPINKKEQKDLQETIKGATDNKGKKDAPSWALPLMSAGFAMMASKSPNFLQALGEGGQEGIKTLTGMKESERAQRLEEAQIEGYKAQAEKNRRGTSKVQIITDDQGRQVYAVFSPATEDFKILTKDDNTPRYATRSRADIAQEILKNQPMITEDELTKQVNMVIQQELNVAQGNITDTTKEEPSGGFSFLDFGGNVIKELFQ